MERNHTPMKNLNTSLVKTKTMTRRVPPAEADLEERAEALAGLALHGGRSGLASYHGMDTHRWVCVHARAQFAARAHAVLAFALCSSAQFTPKEAATTADHATEAIPTALSTTNYQLALCMHYRWLSLRS
jgi:hypothetical protein